MTLAVERLIETAAPRRLQPGLVLAWLVLALFAACALAPGLIAPHDPDGTDLMARLQGPSLSHWLGTDHLGRDVLSRLIHATALSLGAVAATLSLVLALGLLVGGTAGYLGGRVDALLMRLCDVFLTIPTFVLSLFMVGVLGTGLANVILAIALSHWAWYARLTRCLTLSLKERDHIHAARLAGAPGWRIFTDHLAAPILSQLVVLLSLDIGHMLLHVAGLSFLGLGVSPPAAEWGVMIADAREYALTNPLLVAAPGLAILIAVMAFNRLGDALRDRLDPALAREGA